MTEREQAEKYLRDNRISSCDFFYATGFENMVGLLEAYATLKVAEAKQELDKTSYILGVEDGRKAGHAGEQAKLREMMPGNEAIRDAAMEWAREHSEAPDKDCPDWIIHDFEAGAYFVRQCLGCWNKTE
jgi:hypothetical protein